MAHAREKGGDKMDNSELTVSQAAEMLGIPKLEVNRRIHKGDIKARKLGWFWVVETAEIERAKSSEWFQRYAKKQSAA
jgi:excisionase family DNA binding protein